MSDWNLITVETEIQCRRIISFGMPDTDPFFSHMGCDLCDSLPCDVYTVENLVDDEEGVEKDGVMDEMDICGICLNFVHNGEVPEGCDA